MDVLSTEVQEGSPPVLYVRGELDIATADEFRSALKPTTSDPAVVVDMSGVSFIDLTGVRVILEAASHRNGDGPLRLVNAPHVARLLDLIGLDERNVALEIRDGR